MLIPSARSPRASGSRCLTCLGLSQKSRKNALAHVEHVSDEDAPGLCFRSLARFVPQGAIAKPTLRQLRHTATIAYMPKSRSPRDIRYISPGWCRSGALPAFQSIHRRLPARHCSGRSSHTGFANPVLLRARSRIVTVAPLNAALQANHCLN